MCKGVKKKNFLFLQPSQNYCIMYSRGETIKINYSNSFQICSRNHFSNTFHFPSLLISCSEFQNKKSKAMEKWKVILSIHGSKSRIWSVFRRFLVDIFRIWAVLGHSLWGVETWNIFIFRLNIFPYERRNTEYLCQKTDSPPKKYSVFRRP